MNEERIKEIREGLVEWKQEIADNPSLVETELAELLVKVIEELLNE